ncbi:MAG: RluA family pseudouridine synthase [Bacilli bacterium]|nr:RluA family pseudouridine synthase [Bacilli bacterium]
MNEYIVTDEEKGLRIDQYLSKITDYSRSKIVKMIKEGLILVDDISVKPSYIVKQNDNINIIGELNESTDITPENIPLNIVYEDDDVLVVNKPSGMVVHPAHGNYSKTLVNALLYHCNNLSTHDIRPGIVHRIDKDTSGLLMIAKNDNAHKILAEQLSLKTTTRKYIALVWGVINHDTGTIDAPIGRDSNDRQKMNVTDINSKDAVTHFKVLERYKRTTLIELQLETGRTHQIRVHMNYIGYPIVNDKVYGHKKTINDFGQLLHAKTLGFVHPTTNKYMEFDSDLPEEFIELIDIFKNE